MDLTRYGLLGTNQAKELWDAFFRRLRDVAMFAMKNDSRQLWPPRELSKYGWYIERAQKFKRTRPLFAHKYDQAEAFYTRTAWDRYRSPINRYSLLVPGGSQAENQRRSDAASVPIGVLPMGNLNAARGTQLEIPDAYADHFREYLDWLNTPEAEREANKVGQAAMEMIQTTRQQFVQESHTFRQAMPTAV